MTAGDVHAPRITTSIISTDLDGGRGGALGQYTKNNRLVKIPET